MNSKLSASVPRWISSRFTVVHWDKNPGVCGSDDAFPYHPPNLSDSRSPCPALNTLANHGFIPRDGRKIGITTMVSVLTQVYNISYPLAILLASIGYITCGRLSISHTSSHASPSCLLEDSSFDPRADPRPRTRTSTSLGLLVKSGFWLHTIFQNITLPFRLRFEWTLDLSALQKRGSYCITHDASLVHGDEIPSCSPDRTLVSKLVAFSTLNSKASRRHDPGLSLSDFARFRAQRKREAERTGSYLNAFHEQVSLGECALAWLVFTGSTSRRPPRTGLGATNTTSVGLRLASPMTETMPCAVEDKDESDEGLTEIAPLSRVLQWLAEERLPDGWWDEPASGGTRPSSPISFFQARGYANRIQRMG